MKVALCAIIKDSFHIKEFCEHYIYNIGLDDVWLFEDEGSFSHKEAIANIPNVHLAPYVDPGKEYYRGSDCCYKQIKLYNWFLEQHRSDYDWLLFWDDDEYLNTNGRNLKEWLEGFSDVPFIEFMWKCFHSTTIHKSEWSFDSMVEIPYGVRWWYCCKPMINTHFKHDIDSIHIYYDKWEAVDARHLSLRDKIFNNIDYWNSYNGEPFIEHYLFPTFEEWCHKIYVRGDLAWGNRIVSDWFVPISKYSDKEKVDLLYEMRCRFKMKYGTLKGIEEEPLDSWVHHIFDMPQDKGNVEDVESVTGFGKVPYRGLWHFFRIKGYEIPNMSKLFYLLRIIARPDVIEIILEDPLYWAFCIRWDKEFVELFQKDPDRVLRWQNKHPNWKDYMNMAIERDFPYEPLI